MSQSKWQVLQWAGRLIKYATLRRLADRFGFGYVDPPREDPELGDEPRDQPVRFMQWFGFRSRPRVQGGEAIVVAPRGGSTNAVAIACDNLNVGPLDLKEGESAMFSSGGSLIKHDQAGKVTIDAPAPQDVVVNGGTLRVARETDPVSIQAGAMAAWMSQVEAALNTLSPGSVTTLSTTFLDDPGLTIKRGADRFKA